MPLHLVTPFDRTDARAETNSPSACPVPNLALAHAADGCYIVLRGSLFLGSSYLMALGLPLLFFLLICRAAIPAFFAHVANLGPLPGGRSRRRVIGFLDEFKFVLIGLATLVVVWRMPRFINVISTANFREKSCEEHSGNIIPCAAACIDQSHRRRARRRHGWSGAVGRLGDRQAAHARQARGGHGPAEPDHGRLHRSRSARQAGRPKKPRCASRPTSRRSKPRSQQLGREGRTVLVAEAVVAGSTPDLTEVCARRCRAPDGSHSRCSPLIA
jgi:hypothetical protein